MLFKIVFICLSFVPLLEASSNYPVEISFLVADLKYSEESGIKICEIQHGILSTFLGDAFLRGAPGNISSHFHRVLSEFSLKKWTIPRQIAGQNIVSLISKSSEWELAPFLISILKDAEFLKVAKIQPADPFDLSSYQGILFVRAQEIEKDEAFKDLYPGIVVIDAASTPYWMDKYKMTQLFERNAKLAAIKPEWKLYYKKELETLAQNVKDDIPSEYYVIKPRGAFLGNGVIIVAQKELDSTFRSIFAGEGPLLNGSDHSYNYWKRDPFDSFIVEKFYPSDFVKVPELENRVYDPTIRAAFILIYNKQKIEFRMLGSYALLPCKSIDEEGSLNDCHKAYCKSPFFTELSDTVRESIEMQLTERMPLLYQEMLIDR